MESIRLKARAKINIGLDVLRRREDGYHEVRMIMQTVGLYDQLTITKTQTSKIHVRTNLSYLPGNENNLVYKAAKLVTDTFSLPGGVFIDLKKKIPVAAGMAGGSTDAASVLYGLNRIYGLGLKLEELMSLGVRLGADVPYCLMRGTALAEGIGEKLTPLPAMPECPVLIAKPGVSVSTKFVYENLHANSLRPEQHPDIDASIQAIQEGDLHKIARTMGNVLELVTIREHPVIGQIKEAMRRSGALNAMMSGSGPTVFGLYEDEKTAREACKSLRREGLARQVYLTYLFHNRRRNK